MEFKNKNDYSCIVFKSNQVLIKLEYVHSIYALTKWLDGSKYNEWEYINIYCRRSRRYISRQIKGSFIVQFPK